MLIDTVAVYGDENLQTFDNVYIRWSFGSKKLLAQYSLAGDYVDGKRRRYKFTEDGEGVFPERHFHYSVHFESSAGWDTYAEVGPDGRMRKGVDHEYAFKWTGKELHIYRVADPLIFKVEPSPYLVLTPFFP
jgi:hypothetical protein